MPLLLFFTNSYAPGWSPLFFSRFINPAPLKTFLLPFGGLTNLWPRSPGRMVRMTSPLYSAVPSSMRSGLPIHFQASLLMEMLVGFIRRWAGSFLTPPEVFSLGIHWGLVMTSSVGLMRSEEHTSELQSRPHLVCRLLLEKKKIRHN